MQTILITGGTGFIGSVLSRLLTEKGYEVVILTRKQKPSSGKISYAIWDVKSGEIDSGAVEKADHIVHLAGANVGEKRWTAKVKKEIVDSRVDSGHLIVKALKEIPNKVQTVVSSSAIGWYGPDKGKGPFVESDPAANDFLGETTRLWEESIQPVSALGKRLVILRTPLVFGTEAGVYKELTKPLNFGIAGILGSGKQVMSWVHVDDMARAYVAAIENSAMNGVYNVTTSEKITQKDFILKCAKAKKRPYIAIHVPEFALKAMLGEMSVEVLKSATIDNSRFRQTGFRFLYPGVDSAINELIRPR
jgi:uncharacterized protein